MLPLSESHSVPNPTSAMQRTENYHLWKLQKVHHCVPYLSARKLLRWIRAIRARKNEERDLIDLSGKCQ